MLGSWVRVPSGSPHGANALARASVCAILFLAQPEPKGGDEGYRANRSSRVTCWSTILACTPGLTPNVVTNVLNKVLHINALAIKKEIVENDEREMGERKLLNFGHTYGHAYETYFGLDAYLHGECVGMGMMTILKNQEKR